MQYEIEDSLYTCLIIDFQEMQLCNDIMDARHINLQIDLLFRRNETYVVYACTDYGTIRQDHGGTIFFPGVDGKKFHEIMDKTVERLRESKIYNDYKILMETRH